MLSFERKKRYDGQQVRHLKLVFAGSVLLTGVGFFGDGIWLWVAYLPFAVPLLVTQNRAIGASVAAGHFAVVFGIAALGLINLDFALAWVILGYLCALCATAALYGYIGVGAAALLCAALPYFPGSPLLIAGGLFPGWGLAGLGLLAAFAIILGALSSVWQRGALVIMLVCPAMLFAYFDKEVSPGANMALDWRAVPLHSSDQVAPLWTLLSSLRALPEGASVITGENILQASDEAGLRSLCRAAHIGKLDLYAGLQAQDGVGELWRLNADTCPQGVRLYRAVVGIPGLTGNWVRPFGFDQSIASNTAGLKGPADRLGFLACFEAFSVQAWMRGASKQPAVFVNFSNDYWTDPLPLARLRAKVAHQFGALYSTPVLHTDRDHAILVLPPQ